MSDQQPKPFVPFDGGHKPADARDPYLMAQADHGEATGDHAGEMAPEALHGVEGDALTGSGHAASEHADGAGHHEAIDKYMMPHEVPHALMLVEATMKGEAFGIHDGHRPHPTWLANPFYSIFYAIIIIWLVRKAFRRPSVEKPRRFQVAVESLMGGLQNFFLGIMGPGGLRYIPFLGTMWIFILFNNVAVLVPGMKSPSSSFSTTIAFALITMVYARFHNIREGGIGGYFFHLAGSPRDVVGWAISPLMMLLELLGEVIKPLSLALRLFGNIFGEDKLLASMLGLGMMIVAAALHDPTPFIGVPLHLPFFFLVCLLSTIQATVFTLLASIYLMLMMPHEHEHEEHGEHGHLPAPSAGSLDAPGGAAV
jgi:F-type H+-transporting ATPase subunit a